MSKPPGELYRERTERIEKATSLKEPDRVPIVPFSHFFHARHVGYTCYEVMYDYEKDSKAIVKTTADFGWDSGLPPGGLGGSLSLAFADEYPDIAPTVGVITGPIHDILGENYCKFPGRELPENTPFQFLGGQYMKVEEYDALIENPAKFIAEVILPRSCRSLEKPGSATAMGALTKMGLEYGKLGTVLANHAAELKRLGFPLFYTARSYAPFDFIADYLRDVKNCMLDIFRVPEKVKQACDALVPLIDRIGADAGRSSLELFETSRVFMPLHMNEYLSPKAYREFYWDTLKRIVCRLVEAGLTPLLFPQGYHDVHLETLLELPKGKTIVWFEKTDLRKAKQIIGGHVCIMGGPSGSLLIAEAPAKVEEYMKSLLQDLKLGGGFIVNPAVSIPDEARPENVRAMTQAVIRYGRY